VSLFCGGGFAVLAWRLAKDRASVWCLPTTILPTKTVAKYEGTASWHYYRICDAAWTAWVLREHNPLVRL
jgi:hypothetical protein